MINKTIDHNPTQNRYSKPKQFQNSWSITYRKPNYDALDDPHASYYFLNKSMRKHLASLRKSIDKEGAYVERKKIKKMIAERIRNFDNDVDNRSTKVEAYYFKMGSSASISSLGSIRSKKSLHGESKDHKNQHKREYDSKQLVKQKSKTLDVSQKPVKQRKIHFQLPKITTQANKQPQNNKSLQTQADKIQKQQSKLTIMNKTQHNKFLKFILERKKKLSVNEPIKKQQPQEQKPKQDKQ